MSKSAVLDGFLQALTPIDRRPMWQICEDHIVVDKSSRMPGPWRLRNSPWVKPMMLDMDNPSISVVCVRCAAQTSKTETCKTIVGGIVLKSPSPMMWVTSTEEQAREFMRDRFDPLVRECRPIRDQLVQKIGLAYVFTSMTIYFRGSNSKGKLQSTPVRWLILDEVRNYPPGHLALVMKRLRSWEGMSKALVISTPADAGDTLDQEFLAGSQHHYYTVCPSCAHEQQLVFEDLDWDKAEEQKLGEDYSFDRLAETIQRKCKKCSHVWRDTEVDRRRISNTGHFKPHNPNAPKHRTSYTWEALISPMVSFRGIVEEYLNAKRAIMQDPPDFSPMKTFTGETLGRPWIPSLAEVDDFTFLETRKQDYEFEAVWPEETRRFMAADKQAKGGEHYWWAVRAYSTQGKSRLVAYGRCETYAELDATRERMGVKRMDAVIDCGFQQSEVLRWCLTSGWKPFRGHPKEMFDRTVINDRRETVRVKSLWVDERVDSEWGADPKFKRRDGNRYIVVKRFSSPSTKDFLAEFMRGMVGDWTLPKNIPNEYIAQVTSEKRIAVVNRKGITQYEWKAHKNNHLWDIEQMLLICAVINKLVNSGTVRVSEIVVSSKAPEAVTG